MAARFTDLAVDALADYLVTSLATYLRAVETELGLSSGDLPDPDAYVRANLPFDDRSPRVDVFETEWAFEDDGADTMCDVTCSIVWSYVSLNPVAGELVARRTLTALVKCIDADRSLGSVVSAVFLDDGSATAVQEDNHTRHVLDQPVVVRMHEVL
jgi:hypothetical protein